MACLGQQEYHKPLYSQTTSIQRLGGGFTIKEGDFIYSCVDISRSTIVYKTWFKNKRL